MRLRSGGARRRALRSLAVVALAAGGTLAAGAASAVGSPQDASAERGPSVLAEIGVGAEAVAARAVADRTGLRLGRSFAEIGWAEYTVPGADSGGGHGGRARQVAERSLGAKDRLGRAG